MAKFWNNIISGLKAKKGNFTGTSGNEAQIEKAAVLNSPRRGEEE